MLSGSMRIRWGDRLEQELMVEPGDLLYVPPRETHVLENPSDTEPADYVVGRDSPLEDAVIVPVGAGRGMNHAVGTLAGVGGRQIFCQSWLADDGAGRGRWW